MYKNLFIDLDDTIWAFTENSKDSFEEVYNLYQFDRYFDSFESFFTIYMERNHELWEEYSKGNITKDELNKKRFAYPLEMVGVYDEKLVTSYSDTYLKLIPTKGKLMPYAGEALKYLSSKYHLFIISNGFRELQSHKMEAAGITSYFKQVILSEDILVLKPNPQIFHYALSATQSELKDSLMIGDNWDADIKGAKGVGMDQMFYNFSNKKDFEFKPTYLISSWKEVQDIL